jgi:hypothetical protein
MPVYEDGKSKNPLVIKEYAKSHNRRWRERDPERAKRAGRKSRLKKYNLTIEAYDLLSESQQGLCKICNLMKKLHVDHDHKTGKVRGLLCGSCNRAIGLLQENLKVFIAAMEYLKA